jgi:hypothetical protein
MISFNIMILKVPVTTRMLMAMRRVMGSRITRTGLTRNFPLKTI